MKKKLLSMGISSSEILSTAEKKAVKGGYGGYGNPCSGNGPVRCYKPSNPLDSYRYCDMQTCLQFCSLGGGNEKSVCGYV